MVCVRGYDVHENRWMVEEAWPPPAEAARTASRQELTGVPARGLADPTQRFLDDAAARGYVRGYDDPMRGATPEMPRPSRTKSTTSARRQR